MKRGAACFTLVGNILCCSEHFFPSDFKLSTLIETGSRTLGFPCTKVDEESRALCRAKRCEASESGKEASSEYRCEYPSASINLGINQFSCL